MALILLLARNFFFFSCKVSHKINSRDDKHTDDKKKNCKWDRNLRSQSCHLRREMSLNKSEKLILYVRRRWKVRGGRTSLQARSLTHTRKKMFVYSQGGFLLRRNHWLVNIYSSPINEPSAMIQYKAFDGAIYYSLIDYGSAPCCWESDSLRQGSKVNTSLWPIRGKYFTQCYWIPGQTIAELLNWALSYLKTHSLHFFFPTPRLVGVDIKIDLLLFDTANTRNPQCVQMFIYEL